jgi:hypothetical protein
MNGEYQMSKNRGLGRSDPDRKKSHKEYSTSGSSSKGKPKLRDKKVTEDTIGMKSQTYRKWKNIPYYNEVRGRMMSDWRYYKLKRTGIFCNICDQYTCQHRAVESAMLIILSQRTKNGFFSVISKEIALVIAKLVYQLQLNSLTQVCIVKYCY